jgi:hypothetical protein
MLGAAWVPFLPEASSRWSVRTPEQGHKEGDDSNTTLQAVAMAAAMMKRKKFVKVNMANKIESAGGVPGTRLYLYTCRGAHIREIEEIGIVCLLH